MAWGSAKKMIMVFLFIGILLLIIGYFYFGYSKEGFQTSTGSPVAGQTAASTRVDTCSTGNSEQKCSNKCINDPLPPMIPEEERAYSLYESKQLIGIGFDLTSPNVIAPTTMPKYSGAGRLTAGDFDIKGGVPWDFDNKDLNPSDSLFGNVAPEASELIFAKCQCQFLFNDINNLSYDPSSGLFEYKSQTFGVKVYDPTQAMALEFAENFIQNNVGEYYGNAEQLFNTLYYQEHKRAAQREALYKLNSQISDYKNAVAANRRANPQWDSLKAELEAAEIVKAKKESGAYEIEWHNYSNADDKIEASTFDRMADDARTKHLMGRAKAKPMAMDIDFGNVADARNKLNDYLDMKVDTLIKERNKLINADDSTKEKIKQKIRDQKEFRSMISDFKQDVQRKSNRPGSLFKRLRDLTPFGKGVRAVAEGKQASTLARKLSSSKVTGAATRIALGSFQAIVAAIGIAFPPAAPQSAYIVAGTTAIQLLLTAIDLALTTFIGPMFATFIDVTNSVCPLNNRNIQIGGFDINKGELSYMWNPQDAFMRNPSMDPDIRMGSVSPSVIQSEIAGTTVWSILQNLPVIGAFLMAVGPYICIPDDLGPIRVKNNLREPPYYFDPTLSIYNAGKKPSFEAGTSALDPRLFNPLTFHYNKTLNSPEDEDGKPGYPVWVDFANINMLNKMAQFYYDASRKCVSTTNDGMITFEYISKFYGLISTTELTCDVQCEISQITIDPASGIKICETIVPVDGGVITTMHHDRRFYFFKDLRKGVLNRTEYIRPTDTASLQNLMEDNMNIYVVTGCTRINGTAPDCQTYNDEGQSVSNPVISLGMPGGEYYPPIADISGVSIADLPQASSCGKMTTYSRVDGIRNTVQTKNPVDSNSGAPIVGAYATEDWRYAYTVPRGLGSKDVDIKTFYPDNTHVCMINKNPDTPSNARLPTTPQTLLTAKYCSITWNAQCSYDDWQCSINSTQGRNSIIQGSLEGLLGAGMGIGHAQTAIETTTRRNIKSGRFNMAAAVLPFVGGIAQALLAVQFGNSDTGMGSGSQAMACLYEQLSTAPGTYILNGRVINVQTGFVMDQGPFINWAPGYVPTIKYCKHQSIEAFDCVNSGAVRKFVKIYHHYNQDKSIKRIYSMYPALTTDSWNVDTSEAACIYDIETTPYTTTASGTASPPITTTRAKVGIKLKQNVDDRSCSFVPIIYTRPPAASIVPNTAIDANCMPVVVTPPVANPRAISGNTTIDWNLPSPILTEDDIDRLKYKPIIYTLNATRADFPGEEPTQITPLLAPNNLYAARAIEIVRNGAADASRGINDLMIGVLQTERQKKYDELRKITDDSFMRSVDRDLANVIRNNNNNIASITNAINIYSSTNRVPAPYTGLTYLDLKSRQSYREQLVTPLNELNTKTNELNNAIAYRPTILPPRATEVASPPAMFDCNSAAVKDRLIKSFNSPFAHDGAPKFLSVKGTAKTTSIGSGSNIRYMCSFKGRFGTVWQKDTNTYKNAAVYDNASKRFIGGNVDTDDAAEIVNVRIMLDKNGNYLTDDYPLYITSRPVPDKSTWFDVPPRLPEVQASNRFARAPGCETSPTYNDCSKSGLIDVLVTKYNETHPASKILKVLRAFTPATTGEFPICDYDVERMKTVTGEKIVTGGTNLLNRETVRFVLMPDANSSDVCAWGLDVESTNTIGGRLNQGLSLNDSAELGLLDTPYMVAVNYTKTIQDKLVSVIRNYIGYDITRITDNVTNETLTAMQKLRESLLTNNTLKYCNDIAKNTCKSDTLLTSMLNRYNFDNYPVYPPGIDVNTVRIKRIIRVTKAGTATPTTCHVELYSREEFFADFLYSPMQQDISYRIHAYAFKIIPNQSTPCIFKVQPFSQYDISKNTMDITEDAFSLKLSSADVDALKWNTNDYREVKIPCDITQTSGRYPNFTYNDPVLRYIVSIYNAVPVVRTKTDPNANPPVVATTYGNTITSVTKAFNAMPNIIELKVTTTRVYYDEQFNAVYYTGNTADDVESSYIIACWPEGTSYEVETGYYWKDSYGNFVADPTNPAQTTWNPAVGTTITVTYPNGVPTCKVIPKSGNTPQDITMCPPGFWKDSTGSFVMPPASNTWHNIDSSDLQVSSPIIYPNNATDPLTASVIKRKGDPSQTISLSRSAEVQEIYYPDLIFRPEGVFKNNSSGGVRVYLPYLANDGLTAIDTTLQKPLYKCNPVNCKDESGGAL